ncbi:diguanylate cyclase with PAS/PAC sensor [Firmicutes bacterium CAG:822]|nr:diguanylate cyclase with PAS/PAC sensor [Firmicutes bacterium CAG:822]
MNKKIGIIAIVVVLILGSIGIVRFFTKEDKNTALTVVEKKWIEDNKNDVIDFAALSNVPIVSDNGSGLLFDFLDDLETETELVFNKLSYDNNEESTTEYSLAKKNEVSSDDLVLYQDNYILVTKENEYYTDVDEIKDLTIGVLNDDQKAIEEYLTGSSNITYKTYDSNDAVLNALTNNEVTAIALPKLDYLESILTSDDIHISYNITEYKINYVITLGDNERLNTILTKYFNRWKERNLKDSFNTYLASTYFNYKDISEKSQTDFRSKRYTYGFVANAPYDVTINGSLQGFNHSIISDFAAAAGIEVDYKQYSSVESMLNDFKKGDLDVILNNFNNSGLNNIYRTIPVYDSKIAIITDKDTDLVVNNVSSLKDTTVLTIKNSKIARYLKSNDIKIKEFDNIRDLINNINENDVAAIDEYTYDYFVRSDLKDYKNLHTLDIENNYGFISNSNNKNLNEFFNFYLSFINTKEMTHESYRNLLLENNNSKNLQLILSCLVIVLLAIAGIITKIVLGKKKDINSKLSKTDKLRYVDTLTSLKNRNYLNDNMDAWDNSEVYPQSVIIIDLNNIAYINDNFGHAEGDKIIVEAASILINHQLKDSEILRTNGNEFLIFIIGHDEKSIVTYIRKLNKEFKELSHGFGAAIGYSMITDEIKTIDDAINEATLDMRNNKEEVKN